MKLVEFPHSSGKWLAWLCERLAKAVGTATAVAALMINLAPAYATNPPLPMEEVAPGVFVHQGRHEEIDRSNGGAIANIGFVVGTRCVAVIDTGGSHGNGRRLLDAVRMRTPLPVCAVINTHVHPDHIYGNAAFKAERPQFIGHDRLASSIRSRHPYYAKALESSLGADEARRSEPVVPDNSLKDRMTLDLGGRTLEIRAWPTAHTETDITVFDVMTKTLWAGDLLFERRTPSLDGSLIGWLNVMTELEKIPAKQVIPGHGKISMEWPAALNTQRRYLSELREGVRKAIKDNKSLRETVESVGRTGQSGWLLFDDYHPHNVTVAYTELEWED